MFRDHEKHLRNMAGFGRTEERQVLEGNIALLEGQLARAEANPRMFPDIAARRAALATYRADYARAFPPVENI